MKRQMMMIVICCVVMFPMALAMAASYNFFECWPSSLSTDGPPYPTDALKKNIYYESTTAGLQQTSIINAGFEGVNPSELTMQMTSHNGGGGTYAIDSFFDVFYTGDPGDFPAESFFDVFVELDLPDGNGTLLRQEPTLSMGDSFFDVFVELDIDPDAGTYQLLKLHVEHMETDAPEPTSLTFNGRGIDLNEDEKIDTLESFFDVFVELGATDPSSLDFSQPLLTMSLTGEILPEPTTLGLLVLGSLALARRKRSS